MSSPPSGHGDITCVPRVRIELEWERRETELALLREQIRILRARLEKLPPPKRPHYSNQERFAILALRAARGWSITRTAKEFLLSPPTVAKWLRLLDSDSLVAAPGPVNRFPDYVTYLVQQLKLKFPLLGYRAIAECLARGGLQISATTVRRALGQPLKRRPEPPQPQPGNKQRSSTVTAQSPGHLWHVDITTVPTSWGLAISWWPHSWPALFPFCFKVVGVKDHFSRKMLALIPFKKEPSAADVAAVLELAVSRQGRAPKHIISDKGPQFWNNKRKTASVIFADWLREHNVTPRFGAVGRKGSIALIERFWRTLKCEGIRRTLVPYRLTDFEDELEVFRQWFNTRRPHSALGGATPGEVHDGVLPPSERTSVETRARYPVPHALIDSGQVRRVDFVRLRTSGFRGRKHLPDVRLDCAA